ncbi:MAG: transglutaminase-like domain-containing protein, partial [Pirellula sp.]
MTNRLITYLLFVLPLLVFHCGCDTSTKEPKAQEANKVLRELGVAPSDPDPKSSDTPATGSLPNPDLSKLHTDEGNKNLPATKTPPKVSLDDPSTPWMTSDKLPREIWEIQYVGNTAVGYEKRTVSTSLTSGSSVFRIEIESRSRVSLQGKPVEQRMKLSTIESSNGEIIKIDGSIEIGDNKQSFEAYVRPGSLVLKTLSSAGEVNSTIEWKDSYRGPFAVEQSIIRKPLKPNEIRKLKYFDPLIAKIVECQLETDDYILTPTKLGGSRELLEVRNIGVVGDRSRQALIWVDRKGETYKSYLQSEDFRSFRTEPLEAQKFAAEFELRFIPSKSTPLKGTADKLMDANSGLSQQKYRVSHKSKDIFDDFSGRCNQHVEPLLSNTVELTVSQMGKTFEKIIGVIDESKSDPKALESSEHIPSESKLIRDAAEKFSNSLQGDQSPIISMGIFAQALNKSISLTEFDNQIQELALTIKNKRGDCVEHALLLASVGRALQIPCRIALGAKFNRSLDQPEMKFHAWVEFHDGKRWVPVDSTDNTLPAFV